ncbi:MAG TPA: zinc ribbon domain-containing protein [Peptococcaceae bacterium]|nr:zinc ribbon domain-containing protein [Peptococcaceae bacterium]
MPMYEYRCNQCGNRFTALTAWARRDAVRCTSCGSSDVARLISSFSCLRETTTNSCSAGGTRRFG